MKRNNIQPTVEELEELMPRLISIWRRTTKETGPLDRLQTREFRSVVAKIVAFEAGIQEKGFVPLKDMRDLADSLLYYFPMHYLEARELLQELPSHKKRVLDLCSGTGAYAFAALELGFNEVFAADIDENALRIAGEIVGKAGYALSVRKMDVLAPRWPLEGKFDLIILAHAFEEILGDATFERQAQFLNKVLNLLTPDGHLLFVDSSRLKTNHKILNLRDFFVEKGYPIEAPCLYEGRCPALKSKSVCYAQRELIKPKLIDEIHRSGKINKNSLKMSYLLIRSLEQKWPNIAGLPLYRVVSPPVETPYGKRFFLCGKEGTKRLGSHLKKHPKPSRAYEYLKRGEIVELNNPLERGEDLLVNESTSLRIHTPLGKPLKEVFENES